jgi:hypothetical protein
MCIKHKLSAIIFVVVVCLSFVVPHTVHALVDSMTYQGAVTIDNSGNASTLTDYQVSVTIDTAALISAGRMQNDCDDIRFVNSDNTTKLSYWLESGCNSTSTKFWVKVPSITGSTSKTIYVHFGNNSATSESSGSNTFIFFDDFNSLDTSVWTATNAPNATISAGLLNVTSGSVYSKATVASQSGTITESKIGWTGVYAAHAGLQIGDSTNTSSSNGTSKRVAYFFSPDGGAIASAGTGILPGSGYNIVASTQLKNPTNGLGYTFTSYKQVIAGIAFNATKLYYFIDYGYYANNSYTVPTANGSNWNAPYYVWLGHFSGSNGSTTNGSDILVDWVRIRKFITPSAEVAGNEPTITANVGITPSQPRNIVATAGNAKTLVTWDAPSSGSGITDNVVQYSTDGSNYSTFADGTSTSTTATVTGLANGTAYTFRVYAINGSGNGLNSSTVNATPTTATLHGFLMTGQSHTIGYNGYPALSITQAYANLKLTSDYSKFTPLIEDTDVVDDHTGTTESPMTAMANTLTELVAGNAYQSVLLNNAVAGYAYSQLKKGTAPYSNGITYVTTADTIADTLSRTFKIDAVVNLHGPADRTRANEYEGYLNEWQSDYETDIKTVTGQSGNIPMFIDQSSNFTAYGTATSDLLIAQLAASENNSDIYMVGPKYQFDYGPDSIHLTNESYQLLGDYLGKALKRVLEDGESIVALTPAEEVRRGNVITVRFNVPEAPLAFDTTNVLSKTNYGFEFYDDSGSTPAISNVALLGQDSVRITLASTPSAATQKIRYAYTGTGGAKPGAQEAGGARGNLRDSDTTEGSANTPLYNWAVHFDKTVTADSTAPSRSNLTATPTNTSASLTWDTNEGSTETFNYGLTSSYGTASTHDSYPRTTSHSKTVSGLTACTTYHYQIVSTDLAGNQNTGSDSTFTTAGCTGSSNVTNQTQNSITTASGGTVTLSETGAGLALTVPSSFAGSDATFQIKRLDKDSVIVAAPARSGYVSLGNYFYDLKALQDADTTISSFNSPLTVTLTYSDSDISGYDESQITMLRWDGSAWQTLTGCTVDTAANTVTCSTTAFSVFSLFAPTSSATNPPASSSSSTSSSSSSNSGSTTQTCSATRPVGAPNLFQIDRGLTTAKLYVTPASNPYTGFVVYYGTPNNPDQYAASFSQSSTGGVVSLTIGDLGAQNTYVFKVRPTNNCIDGDWSNTVTVGKGAKRGKSYYKNAQTQISTQIQNTTKKLVTPAIKTKATVPTPPAAPTQKAIETNTKKESVPAPQPQQTNTPKPSLIQKIKNVFKWGK